MGYLVCGVVEDDLLRVRLALDVQLGGAADPLGVEIDVEVERDVMDARLQRLGIAVDVDRVGRRQDRRDPFVRGFGRRRIVGGLAGEKGESRGHRDEGTKHQTSGSRQLT